MKSILRASLLTLLSISLAVTLTACGGGGNGDDGISVTDYSGSYYVTIGSSGPMFTIDINQIDTDVTFVLEGSDVEVEGTGTVNGNTMSLTGVITDLGNFSALTTFSGDGQSFSGTWEITAGNRTQGTITGSKNKWSTYDIDVNGIPQFIDEDCIELVKIQKVSKFRSGYGHDFSDDFESCRSMKHYFHPKDGVDRSTVKIFSPVNGTVTGTTEEWDGSLWKGTAVGIKPENYEDFHLTIFHIDLHNPLNVGDMVTAGQELGTSEKISGTVSDFAVWVNTPSGHKLVSYFDVMTDLLFQDYQTLGMSLRDEAIISKEERDADPLTCDGEEFVDNGNLENWVTLN